MEALPSEVMEEILRHVDVRSLVAWTRAARSHARGDYARAWHACLVRARVQLSHLAFDATVPWRDVVRAAHAPWWPTRSEAAVARALQRVHGSGHLTTQALRRHDGATATWVTARVDMGHPPHAWMQVHAPFAERLVLSEVRRCAPSESRGGAARQPWTGNAYLSLTLDLTYGVDQVVRLFAQAPYRNGWRRRVPTHMGVVGLAVDWVRAKGGATHALLVSTRWCLAGREESSDEDDDDEALW